MEGHGPLASLLKGTYTTADLYRRIDLLQRFLEHRLFEPSERTMSHVAALRAFFDEKGDVRQHDVEALAACGEELFGSFQAQDLYGRIHALKRDAAALPQLALYVPVRLGPEGTAGIGEWCRANVQQHIMLDLKVDPATVGGCAFAYQHGFHDYSFSHFAEQERGALITLVRDRYGK